MTQPPSGLDGLRIARDDRARRPRSGLLYLAVAILALLVITVAITWYARTRPVLVRTAVVRELSTAGGEHTVLNASGYVTARRQATVSSKVTGKVSEILIEEGTKVAEAQVLARLDQTNVSANLELARAQARAATAALDETGVRLREAEQELRRQSDLRERNVASQSDFDHAEAAAHALRARVAQQRAEAAVAERTVAVWQQQLDDTVTTAPFAGTVVSKNAQPGEMISPMSTGGFTRTGICTIVDMQSLEIEIDVNESYINRVEPNQPVEAALDAYPEWKIPCHVIAIIPTADRNKSTVRVRVGFDHLDPRILPDMSVKVAFRANDPAAARRTVVVPKAALLTRGGETHVFVVRGDRVERRAVLAGRAEGDDLPISAGLTGGERVVVNAPADLVDGARVQEAKP